MVQPKLEPWFSPNLNHGSRFGLNHGSWFMVRKLEPWFMVHGSVVLVQAISTLEPLVHDIIVYI
jgi:hypothetical protein